MKVEIFTIITNAEKILPLFINHCKESFSDCIINIYDNQSTDNGLNYVKKQDVM